MQPRTDTTHQRTRFLVCLKKMECWWVFRMDKTNFTDIETNIASYILLVVANTFSILKKQTDVRMDFHLNFTIYTYDKKTQSKLCK